MDFFVWLLLQNMTRRCSLDYGILGSIWFNQWINDKMSYLTTENLWITWNLIQYVLAPKSVTFSFFLATYQALVKENWKVIWQKQAKQVNIWKHCLVTFNLLLLNCLFSLIPQNNVMELNKVYGRERPGKKLKYALPVSLEFFLSNKSRKT